MSRRSSHESECGLPLSRPRNPARRLQVEVPSSTSLGHTRGPLSNPDYLVLCESNRPAAHGPAVPRDLKGELAAAPHCSRSGFPLQGGRRVVDSRRSHADRRLRAPAVRRSSSNALLMAGSLVVALCVLEILARLLFPNYADSSRYLDTAFIRLLNSSVVFDPHSENYSRAFGYRLSPNAKNTESTRA